MKSKPRAISPSASHEEVFVQRYRWLLGWALRLTNGDREQAEDLVHDTFVQYMISQPDLEAIRENIEGYFYRMLRNMHVSQVRRSVRLRETAFPIADILSISETASIQNELKMSGQRLQVQDELCRICQYASLRKDSSKIGSVVILRFFHGYYPNEIAAVTRSSRAGVDKMLQRARSEARLYLKDPESLSFLNAAQSAPAFQITFGQEPDDLLRELRDALYHSRQGDCLSASQLAEAYQVEQTDRLNPQALAHIVCCPVCLEEVNQLLGLPLLADREPEKMTGREKRDRDKGDGPGDGSGTTGDFMEKPRRRLRQALEHRPKELRVSVNGFILGSHTVNSELNRLSISAKGEEKVGFVEVFSEEEVRLLFCLVEPPPDGPVEQTVKARLSNDRSLELSLDFSDSWPALDVTYRDPTFAMEAEGLIHDSALQCESQEFVGTESVGDEVSTRSGSDGVEVQSPKSKVQSPSVESIGMLGGLRRRWADFGPSTFDFGQFLRPSFVTVVFACVLIAALAFFYLRKESTSNFTAADLLQRSIAGEDLIAARTDQVLHRTISFESRSAKGNVISRQKIEVWRSAEKGIVARRLYSERGALVAGDWRRADGVQTLYHHRAQPKLQPVPEKRQVGIVTAENIWQLDPSAKDFSSLIGDPQNTTLRETDNAYVLNYSGPNSDGRLRGATLTLAKSDLHPTELTVLLPSDTRAEAESQAVEFHFVEVSFERRPVNAVAPAVFEPDIELLSSSKPETTNSKIETLPFLPLSPSPVLATPELEVEVLRLLNSAGGDLSDQVAVTRTSEGRLNIGGTVETANRKTEILRALNSVANHPAVKISVETVAEAEQRQRQSGAGAPKTIQLQQVQIAKAALPVEPELRRYIASRGLPADQVDQEITKFASRIMRRSLQTLLYVRTLRQTINRFSPDELRTLTPDVRQKLMALVRDQTANLHRELLASRNELQAVVSANGTPTEQLAIANDADLVRAINRLVELVSQCHESIRASFTVSYEGSGAAPVKDAHFWRSLKSAESLAGRISRLQQ